MVTVIAVVLVLGGLIFFHELGHFAVARSLGMGVSTFSLGFGPKILKWKPGKTEFALSLVPLGGYVALVGETDPEDIPEGFTEEESFSLRPAWQRLLVVAAGPIANMLLAWLLLWGIVFCYGTSELLPVVGAIGPDTPAAQAGLKPQDVIVSMDGAPVNTWAELADGIAASEGRTLNLEVARPEFSGQDDKTPVRYSTVHLKVTPQKSARKTVFGEDEIVWLIGVRAAGAVKSRESGFFEAAWLSVGRTWEMLVMTWQGFVKLVQRVIPMDQLGGPIMIVQMVGEQAEQGMNGLLALTAIISINLAILNLLPIPMLDGGTILFCIMEMILRRPLNEKLQTYAMRTGIFVLVCLMLLATFNDVLRLLKDG
ncbi:MAG: RIP metalloprotease RseP [Desulfovibrio sp.]|nr:RIP metalloprotease RseP [Desulfovibrio sp.]